MSNKFPFSRHSYFDEGDNTITLFYFHKGAEVFGADLDRIIHGFIEEVPLSPTLSKLISERVHPLIKKCFPSKRSHECLQKTFSLKDPEIAGRKMAEFDTKIKTLIKDLRKLFIGEMPKLMEAGRAKLERTDGKFKSLSYWQKDEEF